MRSKFWSILEGITLIIWIIVTLIFVITVYSKGTKCLNNPLTFGAKELENKNNATFTCDCKFENEPNYIIFVDSKHWELKENKLPF